jgi:hypothetical protein
VAAATTAPARSVRAPLATASAPVMRTAETLLARAASEGPDAVAVDEEWGALEELPALMEVVSAPLPLCSSPDHDNAY